MISGKKLERIEKALGKETLDQLNSQSPQELKASIIQSESSIKCAVEELEANPAVQQLKESLKAVSQGLREVKKRQNAIIQYALHRLEE